jgi:hypothetical protein
MLQGIVGSAVGTARAGAAASRRSRLVRLSLVAAAIFGIFALLFTWPARLFDADSYLHLALARTIAAHGFLDHLEWARFSTLGHTYGDKELLFHLLLVPFVKLADAELGGKLALALLCAVIAGSLGRLAARALGRPGLAIPLFVFGSGSFMLRAIRLRPELLALGIAIWIVWALAHKHYRSAALLSFAFTFAHTAFHSLLGLAVLFFAWVWCTERRAEWPMLAATCGGVALAIVAHPQFPANLHVFWVQNVEFFRLKDRLDVGGEFQPHTLGSLLQLDGLFWLGLLALARSSAPGDRNAAPSGSARRMASFCWIATAAFGALFVQMGRFATLVMPFAALACAFELAARGGVTERIRVIGNRALPATAVLAVLAALSCVNAVAIAFVNWRISGSFDPSLRVELERLARKLPPGARVAANWNDAELYAFHAPHARYLNIYDPVFMAADDPARYALWASTLAGELPDVPATTIGALESEFIAVTTGAHPELERRLASDPRVQLLHRGRHLLYRIHATDSHFIGGWALDTRDASSNHGKETSSPYVDATARLGRDGCATYARADPLASAPHLRLIELAAWGPTVLFIDGKQRLQLPAANLARLGEGAAIPIRVEANAQGESIWKVRTCAHEGRAGFYVVDRSVQ